MFKTTMVDPANDIAKQAHQGSVAAIIQILNDKLADGIRTRAMLADGILQLLCEAARADQLEQVTVVEHIRQILEAIAPRNIHRIRINSRIVREQQLLWLEEINRDPENQLLWSQEITLTKPGLIKQFKADLSDYKTTLKKTVLPQANSNRSGQRQQQFWRGMVGGAALSLLLLLAGWAMYKGWLTSQLGDQTQAKIANPSEDSSPTQASPANSPDPLTSASPSSSPSPKVQDPFAEAVRIAEKTSESSRTVQSSAEWLELAARWQQASDWMKMVPLQDKRYKTAQDRMSLYRKNSEAAQQKAQARRS